MFFPSFPKTSHEPYLPPSLHQHLCSLMPSFPHCLAKLEDLKSSHTVHIVNDTPSVTKSPNSYRHTRNLQNNQSQYYGKPFPSPALNAPKQLFNCHTPNITLRPQHQTHILQTAENLHPYSFKCRECVPVQDTRVQKNQAEQ